MRGIVTLVGLILAIPFGMALFSTMMTENANVTGQPVAVQTLFNELPTVYMLFFGGGVIVLAVVGAMAFFLRRS